MGMRLTYCGRMGAWRNRFRMVAGIAWRSTMLCREGPIHQAIVSQSIRRRWRYHLLLENPYPWSVFCWNHSIWLYVFPPTSLFQLSGKRRPPLSPSLNRDVVSSRLMDNLLRTSNPRSCDWRFSSLFLSSDKTSSPTSISESESRVEVSPHRSTPSERPSPSPSSPTTPSTLTNPQKMNSERQSLITIELFSSVILVAANPRSTVDAVPVPDSKSRTVKQYIKLCDWF